MFSGAASLRGAAFPDIRALRLAANSATSRRPRSWARLERENCASAPCRLYSTDDRHPGLAVAFGGEPIGDLALGARAGAPVAAGAADDAAQLPVVALDRGGAGERRHDRAELHAHACPWRCGRRARSARHPAGRRRPPECRRRSPTPSPAARRSRSSPRTGSSPCAAARLFAIAGAAGAAATIGLRTWNERREAARLRSRRNRCGRGDGLRARRRRSRCCTALTMPR